MPLYIFCGEQLLCARLRTADQDGAAGTTEELACMIERIRARWPQVRIIVRGDGGFCREELMSWCEGQGVEYVLGLAKNARLKALIAEELQQAKAEYESSGEAARVFRECRYQTLESWSRERRVVGKGRTLEQRGESPLYRLVPPV